MSLAPLVAIITGVQHHLRDAVPPQGRGDRAHGVGRMQHADLDRIDADVLDHGVDLVGEELEGTPWMARTPRVFCAVSAVIAVMP
jgi:hypothetical protein